jgi:hypothetical protein
MKATFFALVFLGLIAASYALSAHHNSIVMGETIPTEQDLFNMYKIYAHKNATP